VTVGITKRTDYNIVLEGCSVWLSEDQLKSLHADLTEALGLAPQRNEYTDLAGDVWAEQTNGTWYICRWSDGDSNWYTNGGDFDNPNGSYRSWPTAEAVEKAFPGGTWR